MVSFDVLPSATRPSDAKYENVATMAWPQWAMRLLGVKKSNLNASVSDAETKAVFDRPTAAAILYISASVK